jgi:hypothetical protein
LTFDFPFILHISKEHMKNFDNNNNIRFTKFGLYDIEQIGTF